MPRKISPLIFAALFVALFGLTHSLFIHAPGNLTLHNKTRTSLIVVWEKVTHDSVIGYRARHRSLLDMERFNNCSEVSQGSGLNWCFNITSSLFMCENRTAVQLTGLRVYTEYWVEVIAFINGSFGNESIWRVFRTAEGVPASPPVNLTAVKHEDNSTVLTVSWGSVPFRKRHGVIISYIVNITESDGGVPIQYNVTDVASQSITIDGLNKYTWYDVTVAAATSKGVSNFSEFIKIQTAEDAPEAPPVNITANTIHIPNTTSDYIVITWDPVQDKLNGILRAYVIRWRPVDQTGANYTRKRINVTSSSRKRRDADSSKEESFELKNLTTYTNYSVEVAAVTNKQGVFSNPVYFMSQEGVPLLPPVNVSAHNTSSTKIMVTWSPPEVSSIQGELLGYEVTFTPAWGNKSNTRRVMLCKFNTSFELTYLLVYTPYNITVAAFTKVGIGNESEMIQTWTDEERPKAPPVNVTAVSNTFSTIDVSWGPVPEDKRDGKVIQYEVKVVRYDSSAGSQEKRRRRRSAESDQTHIVTANLTAVIQNLTMYVVYSVEVRAYTRIGHGNYSEAKTLMTLVTAPSVVPNVSAHAINRTAVRVTWEVDGLEPGFVLLEQFLAYRILASGDDWINISIKSVSDRNKTITGLYAFTTYEIKMAVATNFTGNFSEPVNVTTHEGVPHGIPLNVTAVPATVSSIRVSWDPVPEELRNGTITHYSVRVKNSSGLVIQNVTVEAGNLSVVINNLTMYVTYTFQVQALTSQGAGPLSSPVNQTTKQTAPDIPLTVTATATSNSTIKVKWQTIKPFHPQLTVNGFTIQYGAMRLDTKEFDYLCFAPEDPRDEMNVTNLSQYEETLSGLRSYTEYGVRIQAINISAKDGTVVKTPYGNFSDIVYNTTHQGVPKAPPMNVQVTPFSTTSIEVQWEQVDVCNRSGIITEFLVEVYNSSHQIDSFNVNSTALEWYSKVVSGLQVYTNYSARVQAYTIMGGGPFSELKNTTTHQPAPNLVPGNISAVATGNTTIRVEWSPHTPSNIGFQGFRVDYEAIGHPSKKGFKLVVGATFSTNLTNLTMFTKYKIRVAARTTQVGNYSKAVYATTWEGVPTASPINLNAQILETFVEITWGPVPKESHNGEILGYYVTHYQTDNSSYKFTEKKQPDFFSLQLHSLAQYTQYTVSVLAFTRAGNGPAANITFRSSDGVPSMPPIKLKPVNSVSPSTIEFSWEPVPDEFTNGNVLSYHVTYQRVMIGGVRKDYEPVLEMTVSASDTSVLLQNLEPFSKYKITVAAKTAKGLGPYALFAYGETCHCTRRLTTSWRNYEPYVNFTDDGQPEHIIPLVLQSMVQECCGYCAEHNQTILDFKTNGKNRPSAVNSSRELLEGLDFNTDLTFPVFGHRDQDSYKGGFGYIPVIESAGVAFIVYPEVSTTQDSLFRSMMRCLPILILPIVTAYIAGVIVWALERRNNPQDFPPSFIFGTWEGVWWAFVSMTTLGYGDRAPLSYKGRIFAIAWILFGLIIISITMAMITTALTAVTINSDIKLYGSLIAAEYNSPEYNLGTRRNAKYDPDKEYHNIEEITEALMNKEVEGILVDTYVAGLRGDLFNRPQLQVNEILDYKTAYGIVLSPNSTRLGKCFEGYMASHKWEIFDMIEREVKPVETSSADAPEQEEGKGGLLDSGSPTFNKALKYACMMLGIVLCLSLIYECIRRIRTRQKVHQQVHFKEILLKETGILVEDFIQRMQQIREKIGEKHRRQIITYWKLKRESMCKGGNESEWLRIAMASPHRGEVTVTDMY